MEEPKQRSLQLPNLFLQQIIFYEFLISWGGGGEARAQAFSIDEILHESHKNSIVSWGVLEAGWIRGQQHDGVILANIVQNTAVVAARSYLWDPATDRAPICLVSHCMHLEQYLHTKFCVCYCCNTFVHTCHGCCRSFPLIQHGDKHCQHASFSATKKQHHVELHDCNVNQEASATSKH